MISIQDLLLPREEEQPPKHEVVGERRPRRADPEVRVTRFQIEFILDTVCPHSYVGLKNLVAAMQIHREQHPEDTFEVTFSPLLLDRADSQSGKTDRKPFSHFPPPCSQHRLGSGRAAAPPPPPNPFFLPGVTRLGKAIRWTAVPCRQHIVTK